MQYFDETGGFQSRLSPMWLISGLNLGPASSGADVLNTEWEMMRRIPLRLPLDAGDLGYLVQESEIASVALLIALLFIPEREV